MVRTMLIKPAESVVAYFQTFFWFRCFIFFVGMFQQLDTITPPSNRDTAKQGMETVFCLEMNYSQGGGW